MLGHRLRLLQWLSNPFQLSRPVLTHRQGGSQTVFCIWHLAQLSETKKYKKRVENDRDNGAANDRGALCGPSGSMQYHFQPAIGDR